MSKLGDIINASESPQNLRKILEALERLYFDAFR